MFFIAVFYWTEISSLGFEEPVICLPKVFAYFVTEFHESIRQPLRGVFAEELLEVLSFSIELRPVTWVRVVLELFPKVSEVVSGNREFVVPERLAVFLCGLEGYGTIGGFKDNFYQF